MIDLIVKKLVKLKCPLVVLILYVTSTLGSTYMLFPLSVLLFINRSYFHTFSDFSLRIWFGLSVFLLEKVCRIKIVLHESKSNKSKVFTNSSIVIMNHRTRLDWLFYFCILYRLNSLSKIKIILKDALKKIPGPGWAMQCALFIFIARKWETDRQILNNFIGYYHFIRKKFDILIFPEGTNLTNETKIKSDKFAKTNHLEPYTQVLYPRVTGFSHVFNEMSKTNQLDCVQDVTVAYRGCIPESEMAFLSNKLPREIHFYIEKFDTKEIVQGCDDNISETRDKLIESWLNDRWKRKEEFLKKFYSNDDGFESIQSTYETIEQTNYESIYLYVYPIYWVSSLVVLFYFLYNFLIVRIFFLSASAIYTYLQFFGNGIDNFIMNTSRHVGWNHKKSP